MSIWVKSHFLPERDPVSDQWVRPLPVIVECVSRDAAFEHAAEQMDKGAIRIVITPKRSV